MTEFETGVSGYVAAEATVRIFFPIDSTGKKYINCSKCKMFDVRNRACQITKEISEFPEKFVGSHCPLNILSVKF